MFKFKANQLLLMNQFLLINLLSFHHVITQETTTETIATIGFTETSNDLTSSTTVLSDNSTEIIDLTTESNGTLLTTIKSIDVTTKATTEATTETTTEVPTTTISDQVKVIDYTTELFNKDCLNVHNQFRTLHGVEPLKMDDKIIEFARQRASTLARLNDTSYLKHESGNYGENLAAWPLFGSINCSEVSQIWFDEYKYVSNWSNPDSFTPYTYHFTQIVWSTTRSIGCGMAGLEGSDWIFICCNYDPPGNYLEEFQYNVKPPSYLNESVNEVQHPPQIGKNCKCTCQV